MERLVGTVSRGVRAPIIREGDNLVQIVVDSVLAAGQSEGFSFHDRDVVAVTEAVVARAQGNYAHINDIAADVKAKLGGETIGVIFPILSRNRDTASQKSPADSAIIFHIWIFILICPTVLAYRCVVIDWLSAISAIHDKIPPYLGLLSVYLKAILSSRRNFVNCKKSKTENDFLGNQG